MITDYHAKFYAHELTKRCRAESLEKLAGALVDAQVDLNPHQITAALFAFKSPLSSGAILADEVGLGKTIEAGLLLSQKWAEGKRKILIIVPSSLRKQWSQELQEKFFLPSKILESKTYNDAKKRGSSYPFESNEIVICSYQFAAQRDEDLILVPWDLVVIDEAHRLRNVYKTSNKTARTLRTALVDVPKVLLTATPLQNSLMELYGLVSFVDEYVFGDAKSFRSQYARLTSDDQFAELKSRLKPLCHRTLRRQVLEYVKYTNRQPITREFWPSEDEQALYDMVSDYLKRPELCALPQAQRKLMTLVMRKLLASSTFAIAGALDSLVNKLIQQLRENNKLTAKLEAIEEDFELLEEYRDELGVEDTPEPLSEDDIAAINLEVEELETFRELAVSITENAKGMALLEGLKAGFAKAKELGAKDKAIIFTESRRTQDYLVRLLSEHGYNGKLVLFNGTNADEQSRNIYKAWKEQYAGTDRLTGSRTADMRAALVEYFRDTAQIMIATEAAAEGINLQFCSLLVNYDLPWNPQRIEQRIGRCHRYGQKHDVVVINFLNKANAADQRVFELLSEKFQLFDGVFGASDEVLGGIESGVDFESRIVEIYQTCRDSGEIDEQFTQLRLDLDDQISEAMDHTRKQLLENFDAEVHDKLRVNLEESKNYLNKYNTLLWQLTRHSLQDHAEFQTTEHRFKLLESPYPDLSIGLGEYALGKGIEDAHIYRVGHPLAQALLHEAAGNELPVATLTFDYSKHPQTAQSLELLKGKAGVLGLYKFSIEGADQEDHLIFVGQTDNGESLDQAQMQRLFDVSATVEPELFLDTAELDAVYEISRRDIEQNLESRYAKFFDQEMDKLDHWATDKRAGLKSTLKDFDNELKELKRQIRQVTSLPEKLKLQRKSKAIESKRDEAWREYDQQAAQIEVQKDKLLDRVETKLQTVATDQLLFAVRWQVV